MCRNVGWGRLLDTNRTLVLGSRAYGSSLLWRKVEFLFPHTSNINLQLLLEVLGHRNF